MSGRRSFGVAMSGHLRAIIRARRGGTGRTPLFHCDTVGGLTPSSAARALTPPATSITRGILAIPADHIGVALRWQDQSRPLLAAALPPAVTVSPTRICGPTRK